LSQEPESTADENDASMPTAMISLSIMETLAASDDELGITQLAHLLSIPKARVHRHVSVLKNYGYVSQNPSSNRYGIGWRLYLLGQKLVKRFQIVAMSRHIREELRDKVGQTVVLTTYSDQKVIVLDVVSGTSPLEILLKPGAQFTLNSVAQGKVILAFGPEALYNQVLAGPLRKNTPHTVVDPDRLRAEVEVVRKRGWADAPEELYVGVNAISAPVYLADGSLFGALAVVGSIHYLPVQPTDESVEAVVYAAAQISSLLGYTPPAK